ncbi:MAG: PLP-dependent aminotransferase family protein [Cyclobacteriaceae bacterium]
MWNKKFERSDRKKFLHLIEYLIKAIDSGKLAAGEPLPTQRELSKKLNLSIGTITKAFKELEKMGYLSGEIGRGTFVRDISTDYNDFWYTEAKVPYKYNLGNFRTTELFNHTIQLNLLSAIREVSNDPALYLKLNDLSNCGTWDQKSTFLAWLTNIGLKSATIENVSLLSAEFLTSSLLIRALTKKGEKILVESVSDPVVKEQIAESRRVAVPVEMDKFGIIPEQLDEVIKRDGPKLLFTSPTFQNPTGLTSSLKRKKEIMSVCEQHQVRVIEIGNLDFFYGKTINPYYELNPELAIYVSNLYFHFNPSLNTSCVVGAKDVIGKMERHFKLIFWSGSQMLLEISRNLIGSKRSERIINERVKILQRRNEIFNSMFDEGKSPGLENCVLRWLEIPSGWTSSGLTQAAYENGILVRNSDIFMAESGKTIPFVRISNGAIHSEEDYKKALAELNGLMQQRSLDQ